MIAKVLEMAARNRACHLCPALLEVQGLFMVPYHRRTGQVENTFLLFMADSEDLLTPDAVKERVERLGLHEGLVYDPVSGAMYRQNPIILA